MQGVSKEFSIERDEELRVHKHVNIIFAVLKQLDMNMNRNLVITIPIVYLRSMIAFALH